MSTVEFEIDLNNKAVSRTVGEEEWTEAPKSYRCHVLLLKEEDGAHSALVLNLPGVGSCGDTEEEAMRNVREAATGAIESYLAAGESIPWIDSIGAEIPDTAKQKWILVHV
jgi:predicted RNase H-like HicB family nuclease